MNSRRAFLRAAAGVMAAGTGRRLIADDTASAVAMSHVAAVRHLGPQFLDNSVAVTGADGATSLALPDSESLWVFGDTVEGPFESIRTLDLAPLRSNTGAIVPRQDAASGVKQFRFLTTPDGKRPRQLVPFAADEDPAKHRVWAMHGACVGGRAYLFYHRITLLEGVDIFENFQLDGMGIARADVENVDALEFMRLTAPDGTREFWKGDQPTFGVWVERAENYLHVWGSLMTGMFLARVRPEAIEDLSAYEYLVEAPTLARPETSPRWGREFSPHAVLFDSVPNEMSAAYNTRLRKHVAFHALGRQGKIVMRTAPRATGRWSEPEVVYVPQRKAESDLIYAAKEHPELARDGGRRLYITFVDSGSYVPQMIEVTLR